MNKNDSIQNEFLKILQFAYEQGMEKTNITANELVELLKIKLEELVVTDQ
ncbi:hypothetical protein [Bacillus sp. HMF5848]|nr:hypothetical protein [Bacillus sp. HMF5848]